jgi:hypothetical protein
MHGLVLRQVLDFHWRHQVGHRQRRDAEHRLTINPEGLSTRRHDAQRRASSEQDITQLGARQHQMLAVVQDEQQVPCAEVLGHGVEHRAARLLSHAEGGSDGQCHEGRVSDRCEVDEPHPVRIGVHKIAGESQREAGFPDPTRSDQRDQPADVQQLSGFGQGGCAADETRQWRRQVVAARVGRGRDDFRRTVSGGLHGL